MKKRRVLWLVLASVFTVLALGAGSWAAILTFSASSEAIAAQASYIQFESKLLDLRDEESAAGSRLSDIPAEYDNVWRTCFDGIFDEAFTGKRSAEQEKACDDWPKLAVEEQTLERRIATIPSEVQAARSSSDASQLEVLEADRNFWTTLTLGAVGTGALVVLAIFLWVIALRRHSSISSSGTANG